MASKEWLEIRKVAHNIWEQEGYLDGRDIDHWLRAERENKLQALYRDFQRIRRSLNYLYPSIRYDDRLFGQRYDGTAILVVIMAQGHILSAIHIINRFSNELRSLTAWNKVLESAEEAERITALYEFIYPIASQCLSYPSGAGRLPSGGLMWRDCAVVQTPVFAPVQETVGWQVSRYWLVLSGVAGGASSRSRRLWRRHSGPER